MSTKELILNYDKQIQCYDKLFESLFITVKLFYSLIIIYGFMFPLNYVKKHLFKIYYDKPAENDVKRIIKRMIKIKKTILSFLNNSKKEKRNIISSFLSNMLIKKINNIVEENELKRYLNFHTQECLIEDKKFEKFYNSDKFKILVQQAEKDIRNNKIYEYKPGTKIA